MKVLRDQSGVTGELRGDLAALQQVSCVSERERKGEGKSATRIRGEWGGGEESSGVVLKLCKHR